MTDLERRQAVRLVRNAKVAERELFMLIDDLQESREPDMLPHDWQCTLGGLEVARERISMCIDLVRNTLGEILPGRGV